MPRLRHPLREKAMQMYLEAGDTLIKIKEIADFLGIPEGQVRKWKCLDKWDAERERTERERTHSTGIIVPAHIPARKRGGQPCNQNAVGNSGGPGGPLENQKAVTHGAYARINYGLLPDDEAEVYNEYEAINSGEALWRMFAELNVSELRLEKELKRVRSLPVDADGMITVSYEHRKTSERYGEWNDGMTELSAPGAGIRHSDDMIANEDYVKKVLFIEVIIKLESALDKVRARKLKVLQQIEGIASAVSNITIARDRLDHEIRKSDESIQLAREKFEFEKMKFEGSGSSELVDDWVKAVLGACENG